MMGKFATASASALTVLVLVILWGVQGFAQTAPAGQTPAPAAQEPATPTPAASAPAAQQPDTSQEPADEVTASRRKKPHDYKNWIFDVGAGANLGQRHDAHLGARWRLVERLAWLATRTNIWGCALTLFLQICRCATPH